MISNYDDDKKKIEEYYQFLKNEKNNSSDQEKNDDIDGLMAFIITIINFIKDIEDPSVNIPPNTNMKLYDLIDTFEAAMQEYRKLY